MIGAVELAHRYDRHMAGGLMDLYYGDSGFFNTGLWNEDVSSPDEAGELLVSAITAAIPRTVGSILDLGCGVGGTTRSLERRYPSSRIAGVNISLAQLVRARRLTERSSFLCADGAETGIAGSSFDAVVAVESVQHMRSRGAFFSEARRMLRSGGWLAFSDILVRDASVFGEWMLGTGEAPESLEGYRELLEEAGFEDVELTDATAACWIGFCRSWERFVESLGSAGTIDAATASAHRALATRWKSGAVRHYLIGWGRKRERR